MPVSLRGIEVQESKVTLGLNISYTSYISLCIIPHSVKASKMSVTVVGLTISHRFPISQGLFPYSIKASEIPLSLRLTEDKIKVTLGLNISYRSYISVCIIPHSVKANEISITFRLTGEKKKTKVTVGMTISHLPRSLPVLRKSEWNACITSVNSEKPIKVTRCLNIAHRSYIFQSLFPHSVKASKMSVTRWSDNLTFVSFLSGCLSLLCKSEWDAFIISVIRKKPRWPFVWQSPIGFISPEVSFRTF